MNVYELLVYKFLKGRMNALALLLQLIYSAVVFHFAIIPDFKSEIEGATLVDDFTFGQIHVSSIKPIIVNLKIDWILEKLLMHPPIK